MNRIMTLQISYCELEDLIWREVKINEDSTLDDLAYLILASFDTMANHLYRFEVEGESYYCANTEIEEDEKISNCKISDLELQPGDEIIMEYDFGIGHEFSICVLSIVEDESLIDRVPLIIHGEGRGIIDDYSAEDIGFAIEEIDITGKLREPIIYKGTEWDYRDFNIKTANDDLHKEIEEMEKRFS